MVLIPFLPDILLPMHLPYHFLLCLGYVRLFFSDFHSPLSLVSQPLLRFPQKITLGARFLLYLGRFTIFYLVDFFV